MIGKICFYLFIVSGISSLGFFLSNAALDSYLDKDGFLHEPFFLIVLGYAFFFIALLALLSYFISLFFERNQFHP